MGHHHGEVRGREAEVGLGGVDEALASRARGARQADLAAAATVGVVVQGIHLAAVGNVHVAVDVTAVAGADGARAASTGRHAVGDGWADLAAATAVTEVVQSVDLTAVRGVVVAVAVADIAVADDARSAYTDTGGVGRIHAHVAAAATVDDVGLGVHALLAADLGRRRA